MNLNFWNDKRYRYGIIGICIAICVIIALLIRIIPMYTLAGTGSMTAGPDAWYNLRLVEVALANGLGYISFEPMTLFPYGQDIVWGPLFTWISSILAIIAGAASRVDIITVVSWVPAIMGMVMVPVMFFLGKKLGDWKTGIIAALFIAVIGGTYLSRSLYGHFDHHIAETLFSTLFCLCYVWSLTSLHEHKIDFKNISTLKLPLIYGAICGAAYLLGLMTMYTMVVFGLFVAVFTLVQFIIDYKSGKPTEYLLTLNIITFAIASIGLIVYGIKEMTFSFYNYSLGLLLAHIAIIIGTVVLYLIFKLISKYEKPWYYYLGTIAVIAVAGIVIFMLSMPDLFNSLFGSLSGFFGNSATASTIAEMQSWSIENAFASYNWGVLLAVGGFIILAYNIWKQKSSAALFVLIWTLLMFIATCSHIRWEYYFAANVALLAAVCVSFAISFAGKDILLIIDNFKNRKTQKPESKPSKKTGNKQAVKTESAKPNSAKIALFAVVIVIAGAFFGISTVSAVNQSSASTYGDPNVFWTDATEWLSENTPETGIDYDKIYNKEGFTYPEEAYGVLSWWDYGHYITTIGKRIPNANPFQAGVAGEYGVAQVLVSQDESAVTKKMDYLGSKYVMTDYIMANDIFAAITVWADSSKQTAPYYYNFLQQSNGQYSQTYTYSPDYYNTLTVKLQMFDGSFVESGGVYVAVTDSSAGYGIPVITSTKYYEDSDAAWAAAETYNSKTENTNAGKYAYVISAGESNPAKTYYLPSVDVSALQHFRMVYESGEAYTGMSYVKTYEYVKGAVINGEGTIEIDLITNQGREFTYKQKSVNGQFVVPYSTDGTGDVKAKSLYRIAGTGQTFSVSEDAVQNGLTIN